MALIDGQETYIGLILKWLHDNNSTEGVDFTQPHVRRSLRYVYPLFMFLHAAVGIFGLVGNIAILIVIGKRGLYKDQTFFFLGNIAFSDLIKCMFVLPVTLSNLLIGNWVFGSFLCFFLPMMQCFPIHSTMLTYLMIAIDRYRLIVTPFKARAPAGLCIIGVWVAAVCLVLPFAVYLRYIDLGSILGDRFEGVGICYVNQERHIEEYIRAMFVTLYAMPLAVIGFLCVKVSAELKSLETVTISVHFSAPSEMCTHSEQSYNSRIRWADPDTESSRCDTDAPSSESRSPKDYTDGATQDSDDDLDLAKEKRTQNYLIAMVTLFAICWCPLNILILVQFFVHENGNNTGHFDITYTTFTVFGFLSTCINPVLFASWRMSNSTKDRLRGYFRFSSRSRTGSQV
ncbi:prolactin-releasing peptide receptor-like [Pecten maximus]|uniref:prolactin-releasing peptide receptor-like n=1 Tax=Pecten maximus TaxID=6579 RepID=UPI001459022A|nr:prolactin-releasing peptide receptor-like [Pecten maximus]